MCKCMCVSAYVCIYVCVRARVRACMRACVNACVSVYVSPDKVRRFDSRGTALGLRRALNVVLTDGGVCSTRADPGLLTGLSNPAAN